MRKTVRSDVARCYSLIQRRRGRHPYVTLLGLDGLIDTRALLEMVDHGLPWRTLPRLARNTGLSLEQVAEVASVPRRALARRQSTGRLTPHESNRLVRAARIYCRALQLFNGKRDFATDWLTHPKTALGGISPIELARTEIGAIEVDHLIGRIEHGIFS